MASNIATLLVEIACELFDFGCAAPSWPGDTAADLFTYATPKGNPDLKRPLADIRPDITAVYEAQHGTVPNKGAVGDAMTVLEGKARQAEPTVADDALSLLLGGGAALASQLVKLARENYTLGITTTGEAFAVPKDGPRIARLLRGGRRSLRAALARLYYERHQRAAGTQALADAMLVLEGEADGLEPTEVMLRVGRSPADRRLVLDLGRDDGRVVLIGADGWELADSPVVLWRTNATLPLPTPSSDGDLEKLRELLNIAERRDANDEGTSGDWPLLVAQLVCCLIPDIPHPVPLFRGEHGTAKSTAARLLTSLIDPCASQLRTAPRNVEDWSVACAGSWITCLDNVSALQPWLQDAICRAVTGDGLLRRQLYTDSDVTVLAFKRVIAMTSVDIGRLNGDLADRLLTVELERISDDDRMSEEDLNARWRKAQPVALGGLLDVAVQVLDMLPKVRRHDLPRMADFARILLAVDKALGTNGYKTFTAQAKDTAEQVADSDSVLVAIRDGITEPWTGSAKELLEKLTPTPPPKDWPTSPQAMGGRLTRGAPDLRRLGWGVDRPARTDKKRRWTLTPPPTKEVPAGMSGMSGTSGSGENAAIAGRDPDNLGASDMSDMSGGCQPESPSDGRSDMHDMPDKGAGTSSREGVV